MTKGTGKRSFLIVVVMALLVVGVLAWLRPFSQTAGRKQDPARRQQQVVPVEVMPMTRGPIELKRTFSGTLEARAEFVVAPKVGGRVERLNVDISDRVERDQLVGELDNAEYIQEVAQAEANLAVARANLIEARNALEIANRELKRFTTLQNRGVASASQFDLVKADELAKQAQLEVAKAQLLKAQATLETAHIKLGYTRITAGWSGGGEHRVVSERYVDEGETVAANTALLRIVELDPITGVIFVAERDYARLESGQKILLTTDAFPGEEFSGQIERIAPVFKQATRQARVELKIDNADERLKPGMFIKGSVVLERREQAVVVPEQALVKRDDQPGVFTVSDDGRSVNWLKVGIGIRDGERVEIRNVEAEGRVVTLGQQLLHDGSAISIVSALDGMPGSEEAEPQ